MVDLSLLFTIISSTISMISMFLVIILLKRNPLNSLLKLETYFINFEKNQEKTERMIRDEIAKNREETNNNARQLREELSNSQKLFKDSLIAHMTEIAALQKNQMDIFTQQLTTLTQSNEQKLEKMRETVEQKLKLLQEDNNQIL